MAEKKTMSIKPDELRRRAEEAVLAKTELIMKNIKEKLPQDSRSLLQELKVHQIELQMQNEELRSVQEQLEASRERYFDLYDLAPIGYITLDEKGLVQEANLTAAKLMGVARSALVRHPLVRFILPADKDIFYHHHRELFNTGSLQTCEFRMLCSDGTSFWVEMEASAGQDSDGSPMCRAMILNITERKEAEETLKKSGESYRTIFEAANDAIFVHDPQTGSILDVNKKMCEMYSYTHEEALKLDVGDLSEGSPPYSRKEAVEQVKKAYRKGPQLFEWMAKDRTGRLFWVEVNLKLAIIGGEERIIAIVRDITERKKTEEEKEYYESQFLQAQKLESLGILTGSIAHDFNNLLQIISGNIELTLLDHGMSEKSRKYLSDSMHATKRAADLTNQMLAYSGNSMFNPINIDINKIIRDVEVMLVPLIPKNVQAVYNLAPGLPDIDSDPSQITQIIVNLMINAYESIGDNSGTITLSTGFGYFNSYDLVSIWVKQHPKAGEYVFIEIIDNGIGMDKGTLKKLFDPFFTTKFIGRGLGLSAVHGILRAHNGTVKIESEPGSGTTVRVFLPVSKSSRKPAEVEAPALEGKKTRGSILIVDDDELVLNVGTNMLMESGFEVTVAVDGIQALEILTDDRRSARGKRIVCIVLDIAMPRMDGAETLREIWKIDPETPVVIISGYTEEVARGKLEGMEFPPFLKKPFLMKALVNLVGNVIKGETADF
jgi:two-component system, cell cycle sensor histidine kinase and response regulator CckA